MGHWTGRGRVFCKKPRLLAKLELALSVARATPFSGTAPAHASVAAGYKYNRDPSGKAVHRKS